MSNRLDEHEDFEWYKKSLDVSGRYNHRHRGEPSKYPCRVVSEYWDDPNGPYTYHHSFIYQQEVVCQSCNHVTTVWPEQAGEVEGEE